MHLGAIFRQNILSFLFKGACDTPAAVAKLTDELQAAAKALSAPTTPSLKLSKTYQSFAPIVLDNTISETDKKEFYKGILQLRNQYRISSLDKLQAEQKVKGFLGPLSYDVKGNHELISSDMEKYAKENPIVCPCAVILNDKKQVIAYSLFQSPLAVFADPKNTNCIGMKTIVDVYNKLRNSTNPEIKEALKTSTLQNTWFIDEVCIHEAHRRRGQDKSLLNQLMDAQSSYTKKQGCKYLATDHHLENDAARRACKYLGFDLIPRKLVAEAQFSYPGGKHVMKLKMVK